MQNSRLEQLLSFLKEDPNDPFLLYAIAIEYEKSNQLDKVKEYFSFLLQHHEDYLATYYTAGKFYESIENKDLAIEVFTKGLQKAKQQNNFKTASEIQNALNELLFDE
ncbi:MAG: tetratricopeptide repeat protein [Cytophagaceae bacterium]